MKTKEAKVVDNVIEVDMSWDVENGDIVVYADDDPVMVIPYDQFMFVRRSLKMERAASQHLPVSVN